MNKQILKYFLICLILIITFLTIKTISKPNDTLIIGMMSGWAPFMTINSEGNYEGFDVDLAKEIGKQLNIKIEIKDLGNLSTTFLSMEQNKIDCIMSGLDITKARLDKMQMIPYTGETITKFSLIFWNKIPTNIKTIYDFKNYPNSIVCVEPGSSLEKFLDKFNFINQKTFSKTEEMILDIKYGKSIAALLNADIAKIWANKVPELKKLDIELPEEFIVFGMGIALKKENLQLFYKLKQAIKILKQNKTIKKLEEKWNLKETSC